MAPRSPEATRRLRRARWLDRLAVAALVLGTAGFLTAATWCALAIFVGRL